MIDPPSNNSDAGMAEVVEITAAPKRGPGRPRKIEAAPQEADLAHHAAVIAEKSRFMDVDELVVSLKGRKDAREILHQILVGLAREAAALEFQRIQLERRGRDASQTSSRKIDALRKAAEIQFQLRRLELENVNITSEQTMKLIAFWVEQTIEVAREVMPPELFDVFANRLATKVKDFEAEAEARVR